MGYMNDLSIKMQEDEMTSLGGYTPDLYPPSYDKEVDPNPRLLELETQVARLTAERNLYGRHVHGCCTENATGCLCGWTQARKDTLWDYVDDSEDIEDAIESHHD